MSICRPVTAVRSIAIAALLLSTAAAPGAKSGMTLSGASAAPIRVPAFECEAYVGYDRDMKLPGYILPTSAGKRTCVPFTSSYKRPPAGYTGDYYVDEFTDQKLREAWEDCKQDKACHKRVFDQVMKRHPPNREYTFKDPRERFLLGKIDERGSLTDLGQVRRPAYFAQAPYNEGIAAVDPQTHIVEFTMPVEPYERIHRNMIGDVKIRGWYMRGAGVDDGRGNKRRALIVASGGGGDRVTAIDDPADVGYVVDPQTGVTIPDDDWPKGGTGVQGQRHWREIWRKLHAAGFDVLALERRGVGISGGYSDTNTLQQGRDLLDVAAQLRSGEGMRALSPTGKLSLGKAAAEAVRGGDSDSGLPTFFLGSSRGTMASGWAMTINFDKDCSYDLPEIRCGEPRGDPSIKGALLFAEFSSGVGFNPAETTLKDDGRGPGRDRGLFIGGIEKEHNIVFFPSSAILAGISKWPNAFFARGLWCYADALEGTVESYRRVKGLRELVVVRGPHAVATWPADEKARVVERAVAFARAAVFEAPNVPGQRPWSDMKQLVATASDVWEPSTKPTLVR